MASSFTYAGHYYPDSYSSDGEWRVRFELNFSHTSPTDGSYNYKIRYWCHEESVDQPIPFETGVLLSESSGQHSAQQTHVFTVSLWLTAGSTYYFDAELWYQANNGEWHASALGMVGRQIINVKAADDGTTVDPPDPTPDADISVSTTEIKNRSVKFRGTIEPFQNQSYYYRVLIYISTNSSVDIDNYQYFVSSDYSYSSGSNLSFTNMLWDNGVQPGTKYYWIAYIGYNTSNSGSGWYYPDVWDSGYFTTASNPELLPWSWQKSSGSWNAEESSNSSTLHSDALYAIGHARPTTEFSFRIWNDMISWITYNLSLLGVSYSAQVKSSAEMSSNSTTMGASRWGNFKTLADTLLSSLGSSNRINSHSRGDYCNGSAFTSAVNTVNDAISAYNNS